MATTTQTLDEKRLRIKGKAKNTNTFWGRMRRLQRAWVGVALVGIVVAMAVFAPLLAPSSPTQQYRDGLSELGMPLAPDARFPLGTDHLGRDVLSRVLYGARVSLLIAFTVNFSAALFGTFMGVTSGYFGGWVDGILMRFTDILLAFPAILLALGMSAVLRPSVRVVIIVIAIITWPPLARLVRSQVIAVRNQDFVESARSVGAGHLHIIFFHILPHIITVTIIWATLSLATTILIEAALSYLGVGVPPPTPTWGNMIADGQSRYRTAPWMILVPGVSILITTLGFNLLGDAVRDALDPRTAQRQ